MKIVRFEDLEVWKKGRELTRRIYSLTKSKRFSRDFSLCDQIKRAAISITSNVAEGFDSGSNSEFVKISEVLQAFNVGSEKPIVCCS